jgi:hypothetical protein
MTPARRAELEMIAAMHEFNDDDSDLAQAARRLRSNPDEALALDFMQRLPVYRVALAYRDRRLVNQDVAGMFTNTPPPPASYKEAMQEFLDLMYEYKLRRGRTLDADQCRLLPRVFACVFQLDVGQAAKDLLEEIMQESERLAKVKQRIILLAIELEIPLDEGRL